MATLTRYKPASELLPGDPWRDFENLWRSWRLGPMLREGFEVPDFKIDLDEDDKAYYLKADLPGVNKDDIKVAVEGAVVTITAETTKEKEEKKGTSVYTERYTGKQERSFTLRHDVDEAKAEATYKDGVLTLTLPKKTATSMHNIAVK